MASKADNIVEPIGARGSIPIRPITIIAVIALCLCVWSSIAYLAIF